MKKESKGMIDQSKKSVIKKSKKPGTPATSPIKPPGTSKNGPEKSSKTSKQRVDATEYSVQDLDVSNKMTLIAMDKKKESKARLKNKDKTPTKRSPPKKAATPDKRGKPGELGDLEFEAFLGYVEAKGWAAIEEEFKVGLKSDCKDLNRTTRYVISYNVPPDGDFYDATKVEMPGIPIKFIMAAIPTPDSTGNENFWRLVYDSAVSNIFMLENYDEDDIINQFYPRTANTSKDFGKICVMNKKATKAARDYQAVFEVLPEGCSNSILTRFIQPVFWPEDYDLILRRIALHVVRLLRNEKGSVMVVCRNGQGRSGTFLLLHAALSRLINGDPVNMPELLERLRSHRWGAIQHKPQYMVTYVLLLDYIQAKCNGHNKRCTDLIDKLTNLHKYQFVPPTKAAPKAEVIKAIRPMSPFDPLAQTQEQEDGGGIVPQVKPSFEVLGPPGNPGNRVKKTGSALRRSLYLQ